MYTLKDWERLTLSQEIPIITIIGISLFRGWEDLTFKCKQYDVELRIADSEFASSQICSHCGLVIDRDINAAINLLKTTDYKSI